MSLRKVKYMDNYYIIRHLGRGSEGSVILAEHKKTQEQVAIKRVEFSSIEDANDKLNEANQLKQLNHRHIIKFKEMFLNKYSADTQFVCIILEYCPGGDLASYIQRTVNRFGEFGKSHMNESDILRYTLEIATGLDFLHSQGIVHRDLKPQNILLDKDGTIKITDFGIARRFSENSIVITQVGTPNYMSYQILNGDPYDELTDMYSLGIVVFEMMTGKSIFLSSYDKQKKKDLRNECEKLYDPRLVDLAFSLTSKKSIDRPSAKKTIRIIKDIQRRQRQGNVLPISERIPNFFELSENLQLMVFHFLDVIDISRTMMACKKVWQLIESKWWIQFCTKTELGKELIQSQSSSITFTLEDYKMKIRQIVKQDIFRRKRAVAFMGKHSVHEIKPNELASASLVLGEFLLEVAPTLCVKLLPKLQFLFKNQKGSKEEIKFNYLENLKSENNVLYTQFIYLMECFLRYGVKYGRVFVLSYTSAFNSEEKNIKAVSIWGDPFTKSRISLNRVRRIGYFKLPKLIGLKGIYRCMKVFQEDCKIHKMHMDPKNYSHWRLFLIAINPVHQNKGLGTEVLSPMLKMADSQELSIYTHFYTKNEEIRGNIVRFYKRFGFEIIDNLNPKLSNLCCMYRN